MECPKCGSYLVEDVLEDIDIRKDGIHIDVNEIYKCTSCNYMEYNNNDDEAGDRDE